MAREIAVARLRQILQGLGTGQDPELATLVASRDEVLSRYRPVFDPAALKDLTPEQFKSFLLFKNNRHWKAIHRQGNQIVEDMTALRRALGILFDESRPLADRLRQIRPKSGEPMVKGLARSVITPILLIAYPDQYGVLNQVSESGMKEVGVWPETGEGADFATKYTVVNAALTDLARELGIDLWTLDALWWRVVPAGEATPPQSLAEPDVVTEASDPVFGLELHLHDFLRDNWNQTEFGRDWALLEEDGEIVGYKYNTGEVGQIDLLAKHRTKPRWLVVELKRGRTSDEAVGQALRYRGWVRHHLAGPNESVEAVVVAHVADPKLLYALEGVEDVAVRTYSVRFTLEAPRRPWEADTGERSA
ncbi:MAG: hypothetical protein HZA13_03870 [Nitrospirae bacterium]|nr:hypothetical protein [Nitrospirota bacterium]